MNEEQKRIRERVEVIVAMQIANNDNTYPGWRTANLPWDLAIKEECVELRGHLNWKWWKDTDKEIDWFQVKLEAIDIFHFEISELLVWHTRHDNLAITDIFYELGEQEHRIPEGGICKDSVMEEAENTYSRLNFSNIFDLMAALHMDSKEIFRMYLAKNALNKFRQDSGYKEGTYQKIWDGREDNCYLEGALKTLPADIKDEYIFGEIYDYLSDVYKIATKQV